MIRNITKHLYLSSDVAAIMYAKEENMVDISVKSNKIMSVFRSINSYIHSIHIYNAYLKQTYNVGGPLFLDDEQLTDWIVSSEPESKLKPLFREEKGVFSYLMYETAYSTGKPDGAVIVNISTEWILDQIKQINMEENSETDRFFILDQNHRFIQEGTVDNEIGAWLKREYNDYLEHASASEAVMNTGYFESGFNGVDYMITHTYIEQSGLTLLKLQPLSDTFQYLNRLRSSVMLVTGLILLSSLLLALLVSRTIYKPIRSLVKTVDTYKHPAASDDGFQDEVSYLKDVYKRSMEKLNIYDDERLQVSNVMKEYWLNRLVTEKLSFSQQDLQDICSKANLSLQGDQHYAVCVIRLDKFHSLLQRNSLKVMEILRFGIMNICSEIISGKYAHDVLDMKNDHVVFLLGVPKTDDNYVHAVSELISEAQDIIEEYYKITFSAAISPLTDSLNELSSRYRIALEYMVYSFIYGYSSILTEERIRGNVTSESVDFSKELASELVSNLKSGQETEGTIRQIFEEISQLQYFNAMIAIIKLWRIVKEHMTNSSIDIDQLSWIEATAVHGHMSDQVLSEIQDHLLETVSKSRKQASGSADIKQMYVVDAVKDYVERNYKDSSLCLSQVASLLKISSRQLSKLFRESVHMSVSDYINEVRLLKAAELLSGEDMNVYEVIEQVGIENKNYFFSLFKKRFGTTPKEYALQKQLKAFRSE
ncbi:AraC family transcriptional regulator [Paenibacillus sp. J5C_2022]|nr:AraC family transcriptional regulator [Paenibacillus sp. J5C2022]